MCSIYSDLSWQSLPARTSHQSSWVFSLHRPIFGIGTSINKHLFSLLSSFTLFFSPDAYFLICYCVHTLRSTFSYGSMWVLNPRRVSPLWSFSIGNGYQVLSEQGRPWNSHCGTEVVLHQLLCRLILFLWASHSSTHVTERNRGETNLG